MPTAADYVTQALADELTGEYRKKRLTQSDIVKKSGLSLATVQRLLKGQRAMDATQLVLIAGAIGVDADTVLRDALKVAQRMSEAAPDNVTQLQPKRVEDMTVDEIEKLRHAATVDPEMDEPEQFD